MPLVDVLNCDGLQDSPPSSYCSLLRVALFNLKVGLDRNHIDLDAARQVFVELLDVLEVPGLNTDPPDIETVYEKLKSILARGDPALYFSRIAPVVSHLDELPITCQPTYAFKWWLPEVAEARNEIHSMADVVTVLREFLKPENRDAEAKVGEPLVWLTPNVGPVRDVLEAAAQDHVDSGIGALEAKGHAQRLRDLLGIHRRVSPDRTVALIMRHSIGQLQAAAEATAIATVAADGSQARRRFAAPTQFDAGDYPRFRHWPPHDNCIEEDYGRTWDLADDLVGEVGHGAPEVVSEPMRLDGVRAVPLGPIRSYVPSEDEAVALDLKFADDVCGTATIESLVRHLARVLAL